MLFDNRHRNHCCVFYLWCIWRSRLVNMLRDGHTTFMVSYWRDNTMPGIPYGVSQWDWIQYVWANEKKCSSSVLTTNAQTTTKHRFLPMMPYRILDGSLAFRQYITYMVCFLCHYCRSQTSLAVVVDGGLAQFTNMVLIIPYICNDRFSRIEDEITWPFPMLNGCTV